jgi:hypothetical protein
MTAPAPHAATPEDDRDAAWSKYRHSVEGASAYQRADDPRHRDGALWNAFNAGYAARAAPPSNAITNEPDAEDVVKTKLLTPAFAANWLREQHKLRQTYQLKPIADLIESLAADLAESRREVAGLRPDAERYRWLKMTARAQQQHEIMGTHWTKWDAAIDAALADEEPKA